MVIFSAAAMSNIELIWAVRAVVGVGQDTSYWTRVMSSQRAPRRLIPRSQTRLTHTPDTTAACRVGADECSRERADEDRYGQSERHQPSPPARTHGITQHADAHVVRIRAA